ncbi:hypothetical protein [Leptolyngbya sp. GGD]|uniref:hypothetical protein n=1 Tax=Leptolyngbya sp. GGD TaxID=2997907 RepID=UPI00227C66F0|nr:hypothetical protein [Leptolyngbya sp. GGD]MCY6493858.1 hypothetical protein [Leptolyngbya sp. GGD]
MEEASQYWTLARLNASGKVQMDFQPLAYEYLSQMSLSDRTQLQSRLFVVYQSGNAIAGLCLRCFLSHCILQECRSLVKQFQLHYQLDLMDILPYVLNDEGSLKFGTFTPFTCEILNSFNPDAASLKTWTSRLFRRHPELNQVLKEQGLYLISDWAILNDTKAKQLKRILLQAFQWSNREAEEAADILESYRAVYLSDRIAQGQIGKCVEPTLEQLQRMVKLLPDGSLSVEQFTKKLSQIARCLRQYRLRSYTTQSLDVPEVARAVEQQLMEPEEKPDLEVDRFLSLYRSQFLTCLDQALETVVTARLSRLKMEKAQQFVDALRLFHCDRASMSEIAKTLALRGQDSVTRLLKLKEFRADVRLHMLLCLKTYVLDIAPAFADPTQLRELDHRIQVALGELLEAFIESEEKRAKTAKALLEKSLFSDRLCRYLDHC